MGKKALTKTQVNRIIFLRKRGYSLPEIKQITHHGYGTVFRYIRRVEILPQFQEFWRNKRKSSIFRAFQQQKKPKNKLENLLKKLIKKKKL